MRSRAGAGADSTSEEIACSLSSEPRRLIFENWTGLFVVCACCVCVCAFLAKTPSSGAWELLACVGGSGPRLVGQGRAEGGRCGAGTRDESRAPSLLFAQLEAYSKQLGQGIEVGVGVGEGPRRCFVCLFARSIEQGARRASGVRHSFSLATNTNDNTYC